MGTTRESAKGNKGNGLKKLVLGILILFCQGVLAEALVIRGADLSYSHPGYREKLQEIWNFVSNDLARGDGRPIAAPEVYLEPFDRSTQSPEFTEWQNNWIVKSADIWLEWTKGVDPATATEDWIRANLASIYPFPPAFRGFHYDRTNRIQVNPDSTFLAFYQNDQFAVKRDVVGYGYYVSGHEMVHHALAERGVPEELHHCMYVTNVDGGKSLMEKMVDHLVEKEIASHMVTYYGYNQEVTLAPCEGLKPNERQMALAYARTVRQPILTALRKVDDK